MKRIVTVFAAAVMASNVAVAQNNIELGVTL